MTTTDRPLTEIERVVFAIVSTFDRDNLLHRIDRLELSGPRDYAYLLASLAELAAMTKTIRGRVLGHAHAHLSPAQLAEMNRLTQQAQQRLDQVIALGRAEAQGRA